MSTDTDAAPSHVSATASPRRPARASNVEALRIVSMLLIVGHHYVVHGDLPGAEPDTALSGHQLFSSLLRFGGKLGVDIFVLITGWFACTATFRARRFARFAFWTWSYSVLILTAFTLLAPDRVSGPRMVQGLFPLTYGVWWFASAWAVLYLLSPYLNVMLQNLSREAHRRLVWTGAVVFLILPTLTDRNHVADNVIWFVYLYVLAAYARLQRPAWLEWRAAAAAAVVGSYAVATLWNPLLVRFVDVPEQWRPFVFVSMQDQNRVPTVVASLGLFVLFLNWRLRPSRLVNGLAGAAFGVYLIHDHPVVRRWLWRDYLSNADHYEGSGFYLHALGAVAGVYVACTVLTLVWQRVVEPPAARLIDGVADRWQQRAARQPAPQ